MSSHDIDHRILLLSEIFPPTNGGSGRWFWEMYRRLDQSTTQVLTHERPGASQFDTSHDINVRRRELNLAKGTGAWSAQGLWGYSSILRTVRRLNREMRFDVLHCGRCITEGWIGYLQNKIFRTPYLCYVHGEDVNLPTAGETSGVMSSRQHQWMGRRILRAAGLLIANSYNSRRILEEQWGMPTEKIRVIHPGVDIERFRPAPHDESLRMKLGWGNRPGRRVILTVGRLQQRKGHDHLIQAMKNILMDVPDALYVIVGDGEERARLQTLVRENGLEEAVMFQGEISEEQLLQCYQQCDLFVLPNRQVGSDVEGFGMVLVEAQACGKPVIAGDSGGTSETLKEGVTGRIVDCTKVDNVATKVVDLLINEQQRQAMGQDALEWVRSQFAWDAVFNKACDAFQELYSHAKTSAAAGSRR